MFVIMNSTMQMYKWSSYTLDGVRSWKNCKCYSTKEDARQGCFLYQRLAGKDLEYAYLKAVEVELPAPLILWQEVILRAFQEDVLTLGEQFCPIGCRMADGCNLCETSYEQLRGCFAEEVLRQAHFLIFSPL